MDEGMSEEIEHQETDSTDIQSEQQPQQGVEEQPSQQVTIDSVIEAILFASDEPLSAERLVNIAEFNGGIKQVKKCIETLNQQYEQTGRAFRIEEIAGGFQMMTLPDYNIWLKKLLRERGDNKLSPAALETLAIVAYKQPVIRADVEAIRGVACGEMIRSLMYKGLVKITGKAEILGRPLLYGTTRKFLEVFGLNDLKDLPKAEELKQP
jgi:segregation and condensation protein B